MDLGIVVGLVLIMSGLFRLLHVRYGKLPNMLGIHRYFPYVFMGVGAAILVLGITD